MSDSPANSSQQYGLLSPVAYLRALIDNIRLIFAGAVLAAIAGVLAVMLLPVQYQSSATLLVSPPPFKEPVAKGGIDTQPLGVLMPQPLGVPDYRILLTSDGILMAAAEKVEALGTWSEEDIADIKKISVLRKALQLKTEVAQKTVSVTQYSPIITLSATAGTAEHSRDLVQAWGQACEEISKEAYEKSKFGLLGFVQDRFDATRTDLESVSGQIRDMEITWNDELSKAQLANTHLRFLNYQEKLIDQRIKIATTLEEIAGLEISLAAEPERITLFKSPPMEAVFMEDFKKSQKDKPQGYASEELNAVHVSLREKLILKRNELTSMEEFARQMESQLGEVQTELQGLREEIAKKSFDRKLLNLQETPQLRSYDLLSGMLEQAKFVESDQLLLGDIKVLSDPVLPDRKSWPPRSLFVLLAGMGGLFVSTALVLLRTALGSLQLTRA
jgi:uncharacterized protein involved in exopolysaccharide biosynthesis